ncbi:tRNA A64-2'-O-ribosylphosphate transferase isoform X1 [Prunus avium]|uniref:tRNA A64-2'-O-ribosylphosphate transferase isoform X1 n=2 Tax=Prunus avium TaxID=42229 RepID=A0A6P5S031_PRUAV|nr:tRNA A64-2'-O-ribosylphosphate transferase isoform X1 [Prunus avium]
MEDDDTKQLSIYRAARTIKRRENTLYNALKSIYDDSIFVGEILQLWPDLPLLANLRCGLWYSSKFHSTCYFKSTDGHNNNWSFNTSRLNLHVAQLAGQKGGCFIVDATRRGKRFPDSMSKTIPIWTCVLNRSISNHLNKMRQSALFNDGEASTSDGQHCEDTRQTSVDWDCSLHLPLWVSETEKASIEDRIDEWTRQLEASGADIASLASLLKKPLRPLWISQKTVIWLNEVPDHDSWDFTPIILVSASASNGVVQQHRTSSEFSWNYIAGAGDDEESWARGLTPTLFWNHAYEIINAGPVLCNQMVADIVEKDRVYRARRGQIAPQVTVKASKLVENSVHCFHDDSMLPLDISTINIDLNSSDEDCTICWLGSTSLAVGKSQTAAASKVDCILNCDQESISASLRNDKVYLRLPMVTSKFDRFSLLNNLPSAVNFAKLNLSKGKTLLICCNNGEDISVCVCLAILTSLFDDGGTFDGGSFFSETCITKLDMRRRLVTICKYVVNARPSRGNLKQVFGFLSGGRAGSEKRLHSQDQLLE